MPPKLPLIVQNLQTKVLQKWAKMNWQTYKTPRGDTILAYKALSKEGKDPYAYEFIVMMDESPYFKVKLGSEIGQANRNAYLALPSIYKIITDRAEDGVPSYTYKHKPYYESLLFTATKQRVQTKVGAKPRTGDTQCCVLWNNGAVALMSRSQFKIVTTDNEMEAIETYSKSLGIPPPWDMDPKGIFVPGDTAIGRDLLRGGRTGSLINANYSIKTEDTDPRIANLENTMKSVQGELEAIKSSTAGQIQQLTDLVHQHGQYFSQIMEKMDSVLASRA
jgi:hypothetical protein